MQLVPEAITENLWLVPCLLNRESGSFIPLFKPLTGVFGSDPKFRNSWRETEDALLRDLVEKLGTKRWKAVANEFNKVFYKGIGIRKSRQCRERWVNHLDPNLNKTKWTEADDIFLLESQLQIGNKWSEIAKKMEGRTENSVKNRWKSLLTKSKKLFANNSDPIVCYLNFRKEGFNFESGKRKTRSCKLKEHSSTLKPMEFSKIAEKLKTVHIPNSTPTFEEQSPTTYLFFNS
jgi:Myb-like DNA-binding domain